MYLSIRDDIVFLAGYKTLAEGLHDLNIGGIELFVHEDYTVPAIAPENGKTRLNLMDANDLADLKTQAKESGVCIAALCMGNNFNSENKDFQVAWTVHTVWAAQQLRAPAVRVDAIMSGEKHLPLAERQAIVADSLREILAETVDSGVDLGIENHGFQGNDPEFLEGLLAQVGSTRLGLTLDSGNFYWRGWPLSKVYEIFEQFAPVVKHTHIKNISYPAELREVQREIGFEYERYAAPIHEGDIDHARYIEILKKAGYDRDICLEDESLGRYDIPKRQAILKATAAYFNKLL